MALDFPTSPTNGQTYNGYVYSTSVGAWQAKPAAQSPFYTSDTPPSNPVAGDSWFNTNDGTMYIYYNDGNTSQWTEHRSEIARSQVGIVPIKPTSMSVGSGTGSVDVNGLVTFTTANSVTVNGVFSSTYKNYKIILFSSTATTGAAVTYRFAQAGTGTTGSLWNMSGYYYGTSGSGVITPTLNATDIYAFGVTSTSPWSNNSTSAEMNINQNRFTSLASGFPNGAGGNTVTALWDGSVSSYDGFKLNVSSGNFTGTLKVYGWN